MLLLLEICPNNDLYKEFQVLKCVSKVSSINFLLIVNIYACV